MNKTVNNFTKNVDGVTQMSRFFGHERNPRCLLSPFIIHNLWQSPPTTETDEDEDEDD